MEIWLEPVLDGVVLHYFLHAEPTGAQPGNWRRWICQDGPPPPGWPGKGWPFEIRMFPSRASRGSRADRVMRGDPDAGEYGL